MKCCGLKKLWLKLKKKREKPVLLKRQQAPGITTEALKKKKPRRNTNKIISISYNRTDLPE